MTTKRTLVKAIVGALAALAIALPTYAQVGIYGNAGVNGSVGAGAVNAGVSLTAGASSTGGRGNGVQNRIQKGQDRGDAMTTARITSLNGLLSRIQSMKNISDSEKASFAATIQTEISDMTSLQAKINSDTSTTTLQADLKTIAPDFRIYMLIDPQLSILAATDRVGTIVGMMNTVVSKIQTRLSADATASANATVQADLSDAIAKIADGQVQATAATSEVVNLQPDQGNATVMQSNDAALKDARSKIKTAQQDLVTARKDLGAIVKVLAGDKSASASASTTVQ